MKPFKRLGDARTPDGSLLELFSHDGSYLIRANGIELMTSRRHLSEDRLAEVACAPFKDSPLARVLVGGLGLGFTLRAALKELRDSAEVVVAELMAEVIAWNANPEWNISVEAMQDLRVRIVQDDVYKVLRANPGGFDALMLDTDNGPDGLLMSENAALYEKRGIEITIAALRPSGVIAYWSVGEDRSFVGALQRAGLSVEAIRVRAHETAGPMHWLYVARRKGEARARA
ncbi:spermidine synthase [Gemmatimonadota bacterium]|nr:spermidine synthase [Gemmatimonadota bacterium]